MTVRRYRYAVVTCDGKGSWRIERETHYTRQGVWLSRNDRRMTPAEIEQYKSRKR